MTQNPPEIQKHPWFDKFIEKVKEQLQDLTYVEIATAITQEPGTISMDSSANDMVLELHQKGAAILARTRIELDGDIFMILPADAQGGAKINTDVLNIHKENTAVAVQNWKSFLNSIIEFINTISQLIGIKIPAFEVQAP
jgi:hypothetical protein